MSFQEMRRAHDGRPLEDSTDDNPEVASLEREKTLDELWSKTEAELQLELGSVRAAEVISLIQRHRDSFQAPSDALRPIPGVMHDIELVPHATPVRRAIRRTHPGQRAVEEKELKEMLKLGVIEPCESPWSSPVLIIPKKNPGEWRFAIDYRAVNKLTKPSAYCLPRLDDALASMHGAKFFSSLDSASAFWTIELTERAKDITAFVSSSGGGQFRFRRMPFGLANAPASWQRLMDLAFQGLHWKSVLTFLDDVCVFSATYEDHLRDVQEVLDRVQKFGIRLNPSKCSFFKKELHYLGHIVSDHGVALDPAKTEALKPMLVEPPTSVKQIRTFLGLTSYFRNYVKNYSSIVEPLTQLTKKGHSLRGWGQKQIEAVKAIKQILSSPPILAFPDFNSQFHVATDASDVGIGAVLSQFVGKLERVICYASRALTDREKKFDTFEKEALGCVWATRKFRHYLFNSRFILHTDHAALKSLWEREDPPRLARWIVELQGLDFEVRHRPGVKNGPPDCLSRMPLPSIAALCDLAVAVGQQSLCLMGDSELDGLPGSMASPVVEPEIRRNVGHLQRQDSFCKPLIDFLESKTLPEDLTQHRRIKALCEGFQWRDGALYRLGGQRRPFDQLVIPTVMIESILFQAHGGLLGGHLGYSKTMSILRPRFWWPKMDQSVKNWVSSCLCCQRRKRPRPRAGLTQDIAVGAPFDVIGIDFCGPFRETAAGNRYVLTVTDFFSRWPILIPVPNQSASVLVDALLRHVVTMHGIPKTIVSDLGKSLTGRIMLRFCKRLGIGKTQTTAYQPTSNGRSERFHGYMDAALTPFVDNHPDSWDKYLHLVEFPYRVAKLSGIGYSPFEMLFGRSPTLPVDLLTGTAKANEDFDIDEAVYGLEHNRKMAELYKVFAEKDSRYRLKFRQERDKKRFQVYYNPGDMVLLWTPPRASAYDRTVDVARPGDPDQFRPSAPFNRKLHFQWTGPHAVVRQLGPVNYEVKLPSGKLHKAHVNRLAPHTPWLGSVIAPPQPSPARVPTQFVGNDVEVQDDTMVVIRSGDDGVPFYVGRVVSREGEALTVQWFGSLHRALLGTYKPGWLDRRGEPYWADKARGHPKPYLNHDDGMSLAGNHVVAHAFQLTAGHKLPMSLLRFLSNAEDIDWQLP
jgi:transposase InsO family protein